jgi:hypothetical protein
MRLLDALRTQRQSQPAGYSRGRATPLSGDQRINLTDLGVLTGPRRRECEFWWSVYDAEFAGGSPSGAFVQ